MQQTQNYNMNRPEVNDTFSLNDWNQNINTLDEVLAPEFEDYEPNEEGSTTILPDTTTALAGIKSKTKIADLFKNIKAFCKGCCTLGMLVDNCVTNNSNLPLAASQGKALMDLYTQLNSNMLVIKCGFAKVNVEAINTPAFTTVTFDKPFTQIMSVCATGNSGVPGTYLLGVSALNVTNNDFKIYVTRANNPTIQNVSWIAIGK